MSGRITIFDTTLRDGEQSPGASMNLAEKMEVKSKDLIQIRIGIRIHGQDRLDSFFK